jgi:gamma-glutamyltranspeptidase/glutathione hydrolase
MEQLNRYRWDFPYSSQRMPVFAKNVVATSQPLAAQAGLRMLLRGGNAVDAALAAAIALTVVEPTSNGVGSDAFAIVWDGQQLHGLNGSGRSPAGWSPQRFAGRTQMPKLGWDSVTVPGAVDAWATLSKKFGRLPFVDLFGPAITYARDGYLVSPYTAARWLAAEESLRELPDFVATFLPQGKAPRTGDSFRCPALAETLEKIADSRGEAFYRGELAEAIADHAKRSGGAMTAEDLAVHRSEWVTPLQQTYRGYCLHELPPNGQGLAALIALGILDHLPVADYPADSPESLHFQIEAMKIAFELAHRHIGDPSGMTVKSEDLLDSAFLTDKARTIRRDRTLMSEQPLPTGGGTVYLSAADETGMMVSYIQSNFLGFGSGVVVPGTGISLQNRGFGFNLTAGHPNCVAGSKRPYHTIIPGFITQDGRPVISFGVMGGHMQPQGHVQLMVRMIDYGQNPQAASDGPRWLVAEDYRVAFEAGTSSEVIEELARRGHRILKGLPVWGFGGAQVIARLEDGYCGASDHRKDGQAVGF